MKKVDILENPETGTAGISSAYQLVESSSSVSISFGTIPNYIVLFPTQEKQKPKGVTRSEETSREMLRRIIKAHRETLDRLHEY